ncbi:MAG: hypothetical protein HYU67_04580 [Flavobacteriia bacterium]|nr:hypothetical protein [Flavobacteriia bacterium]
MKLNDLINSVAIEDVLFSPTEQRPEENYEEFINNKEDDFPIEKHEQVVELIEEYDPQKNARSLVYTLTTFDSLVLNVIGTLQLRKKFGGSEILKKMKEALTKEIAGIKLSDEEIHLVKKFKEYETAINMLDRTMYPSKDTLNHLFEVGTDYCRDTHFKMGSGFAFWSAYGGSLIERVTKIIMK